jgi:hypothetical protein
MAQAGMRRLSIHVRGHCSFNNVTRTSVDPWADFLPPAGLQARLFIRLILHSAIIPRTLPLD